MRTFVRSRRLVPLVLLGMASVVMLFSAWGSVPTPSLSTLSPASRPIVPLRTVGLVALGYLPLLALSSETFVTDAAGARPLWIVRGLPPLVCTVFLAAAVTIGADIARLDASAAVRNLLLGTGFAALLYRVMGPLAFVPPALFAVFCAMLREETAWWAVTNTPGSSASLAAAAALAVVAIQVEARRRP